ncbi:Crp/Fnr family transcriptional regulator [Parvibaculum sp.]|jgi:CRP/FNR family transcriptional regulator|uniref:Crp/Fnr family transcriptional regulator n=1 Tax=Parvibaculum sp. TaxID=2024848 RepID=UPI000C959628|nr:Crp/Fnr family transcriptional regulator [Parvibaculum sp.]MAB13551.1 hypothetical protein [Parvibaculum sp.]
MPLSKADISKILAPDPWFSRQPENLRAALVAEAQEVRAGAGHWIYDAGESASGLYGTLSGSIAMHIGLENEEPALVSIIGPGHIFGYTGRFLGGRRIATAVAREPTTLLYLPERGLEAIAQKMPDLWVRLAELSSFHVVAGFRLAVANTRPATQRLAIHLRLLATQFSPSPHLPVTQDELSEMTGLSRKTVNRALAGFEKDGLLATGYKSLEILDPARLAATGRRKGDRD